MLSNPVRALLRRAIHTCTRATPAVAAFPTTYARSFSSIARPIVVGSMAVPTVTFQAARTMFIQTQTTPNPRSLKFLPGREILGEGEDGFSAPTAYFEASNRGYARSRSTLAYTILNIEGVNNVMFGSDFVTVTVDDGVDWLTVKPQVFAAMSDAFASNEPLLKPETEAAASLEHPCAPEDEETVALIKEIIDMRIRPSVMEDGGDIEFIKLDENRIVWLMMKGSCSGCPSSGATLKHGIQNMIMHYVPEVEGVEEWVDERLKTVSETALSELEAKLAAAHEKEDKTEKAEGEEKK